MIARLMAVFVPLVVVGGFSIPGLVAQTETVKHEGSSDRSAAERPGCHHASFEKRILDPDGKPVAGAVVALFATSAGWGMESWIIAKAVTDAQGRVKFEEVNTPGPALAVIEAPEKFRPESFPIEIVSGQWTDLGEHRLVLNTRVAGTVEVLDEKDVPAAFTSGSVRVIHKKNDDEEEDPEVDVSGLFDAGSNALATAAISGTGFVLDGITEEKVLIEVDVHFKKRREIYRGELTVQKYDMKRRVLLRCRQPSLVEPKKSDAGRARRMGQLETWRGKLELVEQATFDIAQELVQITGKVLDAEGKPVASALVRGYGTSRFGTSDATAHGVTAADGSFAISARKNLVTQINVSSAIGNTSVALATAAGQEGSFTSGGDIKLPAGTPFEVKLSGLKPEAVKASFVHSERWQPCPFGLIGRWPPDRDFMGRPTDSLDLWFKAEADGHLPAVVNVVKPGTPATFSFEGRAPFDLQLNSGGKPSSGAFVDVDLMVPPEKPEKGLETFDPARVMLGTWTTDGKGHLKLQGDRAAIYEVTVYVPGCEPAWARWRPATPLTIDLKPRVAVKADGLKAGEFAQVHVAGTTRLAAKLVTGSLGKLTLAPGVFDATVRDASGKLIRASTFDVLAQNTKPVSFAEDRRPELRVKLPAGEDAGTWWMRADREYVSRSGFGNRTYIDGRWIITSRDGGNAAKAEGSLLTLRLEGTGRWTVTLGKKGASMQGVEFTRELDAQRGQKIDLSLPELTAKVKGSVRAMRDAFLFGGARLMLYSATGQEDAPGWNVVVPSPKLNPRTGEFSLPPVPAGSYYAFQHLIAHGPAWGGSYVGATKNEETVIPDFADHELGAVNVEVVDSKGQLLKEGTLAIHDRLHESGGRTTVYQIFGARNFFGQVSAPPKVRLEGKKLALEPVRAGRIELEVTRDDGKSFRYSTFTILGETIRLVVPK